MKLLAYQMGQIFGGVTGDLEGDSPQIYMANSCGISHSWLPENSGNLKVYRKCSHAGWQAGGKMTTSAQGSEECP